VNKVLAIGPQSAHKDQCASGHNSRSIRAQWHAGSNQGTQIKVRRNANRENPEKRLNEAVDQPVSRPQRMHYDAKFSRHVKSEISILRANVPRTGQRVTVDLRLNGYIVYSICVCMLHRYL
jgi:hypothetical protein